MTPRCRTPRSVRSPRFLLFTHILIAFLLASCAGPVDEPLPADRGANASPTTRILSTNAVEENGKRVLIVSWSGADEDGALAGFEYAIGSAEVWTFTTESQARITLGDALGDAGPQAGSAAYSTIFVRAVDNRGARDPEPAHITISGENIAPTATIIRGPSASSFQVTGRNVLLEWVGEDPDGSVVGYQYKLDDQPWVIVDSDCTLVRFYNLPIAQYIGDPSGFHTFQVVAVDNEGSVEQIIEAPRNQRRWESVEGLGGSLRIDSNTMGSRQGANTLIGEVFEGTRVAFDWRGDASLYGGLVVCYEFAFDDSSSYSACDIANTSYPPDAPDFEPSLGMHTLYVRATDDLGLQFAANFSFEVMAGPGGIGPAERRVLYVDDFDAGTESSGQVFPTDPTEEAFWDAILDGVPHTKFDAESENDIPTSEILGPASTVIWYLDDGGTQLETSNQPDNYRNPLWSYISAGGNVILCGMIPTDALSPDNYFDPIEVENPGCPHYPRNTYGGPEGSLDWFPAFCDTGFHRVYDFAWARRSFYRSSNEYLESLRSVSRLVPDLALDFSKRGNLPDGTPALRLGLEQVEQYELRSDAAVLPAGAIPLWNFVDIDGNEERVCGYLVPASEATGRGNLLVLGFAPYFFDTDEMREVFRTFLTRFGETVAIEE